MSRGTSELRDRTEVREVGELEEIDAKPELLSSRLESPQRKPEARGFQVPFEEDEVVGVEGVEHFPEEGQLDVSAGIDDLAQSKVQAVEAVPAPGVTGLRPIVEWILIELETREGTVRRGAPVSPDAGELDSEREQVRPVDYQIVPPVGVIRPLVFRKIKRVRRSGAAVDAGSGIGRELGESVGDPEPPGAPSIIGA
jgi:hypothetical protein